MIDVVDLKTFYNLPLGRAVRRLVAARLKASWPRAAGERVLGLGYAAGYLDLWRAQAERVMAFMPAAQGVHHWPASGPGATALVDEDSLPLADVAVDRILVVHGLEMAGDAHAFLRELWRILTPGGRVLLVVPNRRGPWARLDTTPFGYGRPYSRAQLVQLLRETMFQPLGWDEALYLPPVSSPVIMRWARGWERIGGLVWPLFAGLLIVEASKQAYAPARPVRAVRPARRFAPVFTPAPQAGGRA